MFDYIKGNLEERGDDYVVIDCNGVGYKIFMPVSSFSSLPPNGDFTKIFTHLVHREDVMDLYGFITLKDREIFRHLITVSGIGSKLGMKILSDIPTAELIMAVLNKDAKFLTKANGLGKKGADKIILELESKFRKLYPYTGDSKASVGAEYEQTSIDALMALGYREKEAVEVVQQVIKREKIKNPEDIIKSALQFLAKI